MENKKSNTTILFVIGTLFIVTAGSIFVAKTWSYIPAIVKLLSVFALTIGFFFTSFKLTKKEFLPKTSIAIYYLGVAFSGLSCVSLMNYLNLDDIENIASLKVFASSTVMFITMLYRIKCVHSKLDIFWALTLCDTIILSLGNFIDDSNNNITLFIFIAFAVNSAWIIAFKLNSLNIVMWIISQLAFFIQLNIKLVDHNHISWPYELVLVALFAGLYVRNKSKRYIVMMFLEAVLCCVKYIFCSMYSYDSYDNATIVLTLVTFWFAWLFAMGSCIVNNKNDKRLFLTISLFPFAHSLLTFSKLFIIFPDKFKPEWYCFILFLIIVGLSAIWYDYVERIRGLQNTVLTFIYVILVFHNLFIEDIECVLILGVFAAIVLIASSLCSLKYFAVSSSITLVTLVLYTTRTFWLSIEWWIYLFVIGVLFIFIAIKKEKAGN